MCGPKFEGSSLAMGQEKLKGSEKKICQKPLVQQFMYQFWLGKEDEDENESKDGRILASLELLVMKTHVNQEKKLLALRKPLTQEGFDISVGFLLERVV